MYLTLAYNLAHDATRWVMMMLNTTFDITISNLNIKHEAEKGVIENCYKIVAILTPTCDLLKSFVQSTSLRITLGEDSYGYMYARGIRGRSLFHQPAILQSIMRQIY